MERLKKRDEPSIVTAILRPGIGAVCWVSIWLAVLGSGPQESQAAPGAAGLTIRKALKEIAVGRGNPTPLIVTYDDLHGLWGGLRLTIYGTGRVEQKAVRESVGKPKKVSRQDLIRLAGLLVKHAAWEQRVPERPAVPDESRASLTIQYGESSVTIWEWHNDLEENRRISEIRDFMKKIAWTQSRSGAAAPTLPPEIRAVTLHGVTAHLGGETPPPDTPLEFGVSALWFTFAGDPKLYVFKPAGELFFSDWRFDAR